MVFILMRTLSINHLSVEFKKKITVPGKILFKEIVLLFRKSYWPSFLRKKCCSDREDSRLKIVNLQTYLDPWNNLFKQWKVRTIFETENFYNLLLDVPIRSNMYVHWNLLKCQLKKKQLGCRNLQEQVRKMQLYGFSFFFFHAGYPS